MVTAIVIFMGFIVDCFLGDPIYRFHPVRIMGSVIDKGQKLRKENQSPRYEFFLGAFLSIILILFSYATYYAILFVFYKLHFLMGCFFEVLFCYQIFAAKSLKKESMKVYDALKEHDIERARLCLSYIVGRDTQNLNEEQIIKGAVETVAENLSDGVIAPMFYMLIGGVPLGMAYKAVNTLDSMIGYKNERYEYFGKFAAFFDDIVSFIPARVSAFFMIIASRICKLDYKQAIKIFRRDRFKHKSPNSAQTESVCAGALNVTLSGSHYYKGELVEKPEIGENNCSIKKEDIQLANQLMYTTSWLCLVTGVVVRIFYYYFGCNII